MPVDPPTISVSFYTNYHLGYVFLCLIGTLTPLLHVHFEAQQHNL